MTKRSDAAGPARLRVPPWLALTSGIVGSLIGIATNLYSDEFRKALESSGRELSSTLLSVVLTAVVAGASTAFFYRSLIRRKQHIGIAPGEIEIHADALEYAVNKADDRVVGRVLRYIEVKRDSPDVIVFLHGLGLDANDFRPYMAESRHHCIALTFYGFNDDDKDDEHYAPISLESHVALLGYALHEIHKRYSKKRLTLVGFSFGADMILLLDKFTNKAKRLTEMSPVYKAVLLDPNISRKTTTISSRIAKVDQADPQQLVDLLKTASTIGELGYLCEYLYKITAKDFAQVQRHAREVVQIWESDSNSQFLDYLGRLTRLAGGVHVILSFNFEELFNAVAQGADSRGLDVNGLECARADHFELIEAAFLKDQLEGLL